jgi:putative oxidoreductase
VAQFEKEKDMNEGLLVARLVFGLLMAAHGSQKLFGWFGGHGLSGVGGFFESLGFRPGRFFAGAAAGAEIVGGLLITLGFLGPVGPALVVSVMLVAAVTVHSKGGLFAATNGIEVPLLYAASAAALALTGPGTLSLDAGLGLSAPWTPAASWITLAVGILGGLASLALRRPVEQSATAGAVSR